MIKSTPSKSWSRRAAVVVGCVLIFVFGWLEGELAATKNIARSASVASPGSIAQLRADCPREKLTSLSAECLDLLPMFHFIEDPK